MKIWVTTLFTACLFLISASDIMAAALIYDARDFSGVVASHRDGFAYRNASGFTGYEDATMLTLGTFDSNLYPEVTIDANNVSGDYRIWVYQHNSTFDHRDLSLSLNGGTGIVPNRINTWGWADAGTHFVATNSTIGVKAIGAYMNHGSGFDERRANFMSVYLTTDLSSTEPLFTPTGQDSLASVPEPSTYAMLLLGLLSLGAYSKRRKK